MDNKTRISYIALRRLIYILAVVLAFTAISYICMVDSPVEDTSVGNIDLSQVDFQNQTVSIRNRSFLIYPNSFYSSEDFLSGRVTEEGIPYGTGIPLGEVAKLSNFDVSNCGVKML